MNIERAHLILGSNHGSSATHIKKLYYKKALLCHPDKKNGSTAEFQELTEAYECLSNQKDPVLPILFHSSIHYALSNMNPDLLLSLYIILYDYKDSIPESIFDTIKSLIPPILIIEPTLIDLLTQRVYIYTYKENKYSIPMWHHELSYELFTVMSKPILPSHIEIDDENNVYVTIRASIQDIFLNGLFIHELSLKVDVSLLKIVPYQTYTVSGTIPRIQEHDPYAADQTAFFIIQLYLH